MWLNFLEREIRMYVLTGMVSVLLLTLSLYPLLSLSLFNLVVDNTLYIVWLLLLIHLLNNLLKFGNFKLVPIAVRIFIYFLLIVFTLAILLFGDYFIELQIFDPNKNILFLNLFYLKASFGFLVFLIVRLYNKNADESLQLIHPRGNVENIQKQTEPIHQKQEGNPEELIERISVKSGSKIHVISVADVICLLAEGDYVYVVTEKGKYLKEQTMKYFETNLPEGQFLRVHRSIIVNVSCISRIELYDKSNFQLVLQNGEKVKVSQSGYRLLREKLGI